MTLAAEQAGTGIPLVFLHAYPLDRRMWVPQSPFSRHFRVITVDFPGFGGSPSSAPIATMEWMARETISTLDGLGARERAVFVGLSMGGYVLLQIARLFPDRVRAAAFVATKSTPDSPEAKQKRLDHIALVEKEGVPALVAGLTGTLLGETSQKERPAIVAEARAIMESQTPHAIISALRGMAERPDTSAVLSGLTAPALFIAGAEDTVIQRADMEAMANRAKKSELHVVEKAGHLVNMERPDAFESLLSHFLKRRVL
jgi:pimeloyl-ACP methyl ester carboxylesterase